LPFVFVRVGAPAPNQGCWSAFAPLVWLGGVCPAGLAWRRLLGRGRHPVVVAALVSFGCGTNVSRPDASRDGAATDAATDHAETGPAVCASSADCPSGLACYFKFCQSCPPAGVCKPDIDSGNECASVGGMACTCDGSYTVIYSGCEPYEGYTMTPSTGFDCDDGGDWCEPGLP
jgi:hypothetical protein